ncbi:hypothetical protein MKX62_05175 [Sporosarcina sp. FSL K6-5500]
MAEPYEYIPFNWLDQIIESDEFGKTVYEKDENGNFVYWKDSLGDLIIDPITQLPIPKPRLLQIGTRHSAERENYQEQGIAMAHQRLDKHDKRISRIETQLEIDGRVDPDNKGTFFDNFVDAPNKVVRQTATAILTESRAAGTTVMNVGNTDGFKAFTQVTIYDGTNSEDTLITAVTASTITVQALAHDYVKGAVIARSNAAIADGQMINGSWGTYMVAVAEVV